jgi:mRNA interferase MazF
MEFKQKQIWLVNFDPAYGHEFQKVRPGLIIENDLYIPQFDLLTIVPISGKIENLFILDVFIQKTHQNRLIKDSIIKTKQINSFDKLRFIKYIGICDNEVFEQVKRNIHNYLN